MKPKLPSTNLKEDLNASEKLDLDFYSQSSVLKRDESNLSEDSDHVFHTPKKRRVKKRIASSDEDVSESPGKASPTTLQRLECEDCENDYASRQGLCKHKREKHAKILCKLFDESK